MVRLAMEQMDGGRVDAPFSVEDTGIGIPAPAMGQVFQKFFRVDYQRLGSPYLAGAARMVRTGELNLLLSHSPDVLPVAVRQRWDVVLSGHAHGGQIRLEHVDSRLNSMRFHTPNTYSKYTAGGSSLFVTSGLGTVGVPARLGTNPEIVCIRLMARG